MLLPSLGRSGREEKNSINVSPDWWGRGRCRYPIGSPEGVIRQPEQLPSRGRIRHGPDLKLYLYVHICLLKKVVGGLE